MVIQIRRRLTRLKLLPYETWVLERPEPVEILRARLAAKVEPRRLWRSGFQRNHQPYEGTVGEQDFSLRRIIHYRNSFLPQIHGRWQSNPNGTQIEITFTLHPVVSVFLGIWLMIWYGSMLPMLLVEDVPPLIPWAFLTMPLLMLIAFNAAFWFEVRRSQRQLTAIFEDQPQVHR